MLFYILENNWCYLPFPKISIFDVGPTLDKPLMLLFTQKLVLLYKIVDATNGTHEIKALHAKLHLEKNTSPLPCRTLSPDLPLKVRSGSSSPTWKKKHLKKNHLERPTWIGTYPRRGEIINKLLAKIAQPWLGLLGSQALNHIGLSFINADSAGQHTTRWQYNLLSKLKVNYITSKLCA